MNRKFSVLLSVYKNERAVYLKRAIESIYFDQILQPNEIILVEDGLLTEELYKEIDNLKFRLGKKIKILKLNKNYGLGIALNEGLKICNNELVARMDTDDIANPMRFKKQIECFEKNKNLSLVGTNISEFIGEEEKIVSRRIVPKQNKDIRKFLKKRCPFNHMTVMFKKSDVLFSGSYKDLFWNEDYYLWIRMYENDCLFYNIQEELVNVRIGKDMYKRRGGLKYFKSEFILQNYMLEKKIIKYHEFLINVLLRLILQVFLPSTIRGYLFKTLARE